jgi:hypothetical protein
MVRAALVLMFLLAAAPAFAQTYVSGAVGLDVFRPGRVEARGAGEVTAGGEAVAFSLRVGTALTDRWGVELGVTRPDEIEREVQRGFPVPLLTGQTVPTRVLVADSVFPSGIAIPVFDSTLRFERRNTTVDAAAWVAQTVSSRVDLVYLGGVAFNRVVEEVEFAFSRRAGALPIILPASTRTTTYGVGPVVGLDARLALTDHLMLVPGMRLQGVGGNAGSGWLFRSSVGLGWRF